MRSAKMVERNANMRTQILHAAARVIGRYGYSGCTIARVAARAKIAHGTFYLYFNSQQQLFDELLPSVTGEMLGMVGEAVRGAATVAEMEERGLRANFAYLKKHPYIQRLGSEAEVFAPKAKREYYDKVNRGYRRTLKRIIHGDILLTPDMQAKYDTVGAMIEGARVRLLERHGIESGKVVGVPEDAMQIYLRFVVGGIEAVFGKCAATALPETFPMPAASEKSD